MTNRLARINELIQRELGTIIQRDLSFPGLLVTVNGVNVTPDLRHCDIFVSVIGPVHEEDAVIEQLTEKRGFLQKRLMSRVVLKHTPHLHFKLDHSVERGVRVTRIMEEIDQQIGPDAWKELEGMNEEEDDLK